MTVYMHIIPIFGGGLRLYLVEVKALFGGGLRLYLVEG